MMLPLTKFERKDLWGFKVNQPGCQTDPTTEAIVFKLMHDDKERGLEVVMQDLIGRLLGRHSRQVRGTHFLPSWCFPSPSLRGKTFGASRLISPDARLSLPRRQSSRAQLLGACKAPRLNQNREGESEGPAPSPSSGQTQTPPTPTSPVPSPRGTHSLLLDQLGVKFTLPVPFPARPALPLCFLPL